MHTSLTRETRSDRFHCVSGQRVPMPTTFSLVIFITTMYMEDDESQKTTSRSTSCPLSLDFILFSVFMSSFALYRIITMIPPDGRNDSVVQKMAGSLPSQTEPSTTPTKPIIEQPKGVFDVKTVRVHEVLGSLPSQTEPSTTPTKAFIEQPKGVFVVKTGRAHEVQDNLFSG